MMLPSQTASTASTPPHPCPPPPQNKKLLKVPLFAKFTGPPCCTRYYKQVHDIDENGVTDFWIKRLSRSTIYESLFKQSLGSGAEYVFNNLISI